MDKDIKSIGYGVKIGDKFLSSIRFSGPETITAYAIRNNIVLMDFQDAVNNAKVYNGKVVELYAREVEDSEDED